MAQSAAEVMKVCDFGEARYFALHQVMARAGSLVGLWEELFQKGPQELRGSKDDQAEC